ncbi:MAG TPA: metallophosphoesterase [Burkholderiaceae bacterium]|nr:metallophosphoesterase [Burkholderiaceae bacterium]
MNAATPPNTTIYAIGDIHGRYDLLGAMIQQILEDARRRRASRRQIVYLGDYVSRGIDSRRVVDMVLAPPYAGFSKICLKGNHEDSLLRFLAGDFDAGRHWFDNDGLDTLAHYGVPIADADARDDANMALMRERFAIALPEEHLNFFCSLQTAHHAGDYYFVHAGIRPGVPLTRQSATDCMWMREPFLTSDEDHGAIIVHGHSIAERAVLLSNRIGIDTGAYRTGTLTCLVLDGATRTVLQT